MITQLAPLGANYNINIIVAFPSKDEAKVTVIFVGKDDKQPEVPALSFEGPASEVEAHIGNGIAEGVKRLTEFRSNLDEVQKEIDQAKAKKAAEAKEAAAKKDAEAKEAKEAKGKKPKKPEPAEPAKTTKPISEVKPAFMKKEEPAKVEATASPSDAMAALNDLFPED